MLRGLLVLLVCQLGGELVVRLLSVSFPGPVVGMLIFLLWLLARPGASTKPEVAVSEGLLKHLQLLFVPAGVGVIDYMATLGRDAVPIVVALIGSWLVALVGVAATSSLVARLTARR